MTIPNRYPLTSKISISLFSILALYKWNHMVGSLLSSAPCLYKSQSYYCIYQVWGFLKLMCSFHCVKRKNNLSYSNVYGHPISSFWLLCIKLLWTFLCMTFCVHMHTFLLCRYQGMEMLGHRVDVFLGDIDSVPKCFTILTPTSKFQLTT